MATVRERMKVADQIQEAWEDLWLDEIELTEENQDTFATVESCLISSEDSSIVEIKGTLPGIPKSDSDDIYQTWRQEDIKKKRLCKSTVL